MLDALSTQNIAWYGAIVATVVFAFDVWKWNQHRARLRVRIVGNVYYDDGGFSKVEKTPTGEIQTLIPYYHVEVVNAGEVPTTILGVGATTQHVGLLDRVRARRRKAKGTMAYGGAAFVIHYGKLTPHVLGPGEVWSCRVPEDKIVSLCQCGRPKLQLTAACWTRPALIPFPLPAKK